MNEFKPKRIMRTWIKKQLPKWKTLSNDFKQSNEIKKKKKKTYMNQPKWACQIYKLSNEIKISQQKIKKNQNPTPNKSNVEKWIWKKKSIKKN
jgi:hypothetical protein